MIVSYVFTPTDAIRIIHHGSGRIAWGLRIAFAVIVIAFALWDLKNFRLDWEHAAFIVAAVYLAFWSIVGSGAMLGLLFVMRPSIRVTIDDSRITTESRQAKQQIAWSSIAGNGSATESRNHFYLKCPWQSIFIPKRAFKTENEMIEFRALVAAKVGDRCKFHAESPEPA